MIKAEAQWNGGHPCQSLCRTLCFWFMSHTVSKSLSSEQPSEAVPRVSWCHSCRRHIQSTGMKSNLRRSSHETSQAGRWQKIVIFIWEIQFSISDPNKKNNKSWELAVEDILRLKSEEESSKGMITTWMYFITWIQFKIKTDQLKMVQHFKRWDNHVQSVVSSLAAWSEKTTQPNCK